MRARYLTGFCALIVCLLAARPAVAQSLRVGLTGGMNLSEINASGDESLNVIFTDKVEPAGGISFLIQLSSVASLQTDALVSVKGSKLDLSGRDHRIRLTYAEVPFLVRFAGPERSAVKLHMLGGVYGGYLIDARYRIEGTAADTSVDVTDSFRSFDYGWVAGFALGFGGSVLVDARYSGGIPEMREEASFVGILSPRRNVKLRNRGFAFLGTYLF